MLPDRRLAYVDTLALFFGITYVFTNAANLFQCICAHGRRQALIGVDVRTEFFFSALALPTDAAVLAKPEDNLTLFYTTISYSIYTGFRRSILGLHSPRFLSIPEALVFTEF